MGQLNPGGSIIKDRGLASAAPGYKRIDGHFCRAYRPGRITVDIANIDFTTAGSLEIDFLDGVVTLDGVLAADSGLMFPDTATCILISTQHSVKAAAAAGTIHTVTIHGQEESGVTFESAVYQIAEPAGLVIGTVLGAATLQIKMPVYGGSKIKRSVTVTAGDSVGAVRILGYWD